MFCPVLGAALPAGRASASGRHRRPCHPAPPQAPAHLQPLRPPAARHAPVLALPGGLVLRRGLPAGGVAGEGGCAWPRLGANACPVQSKGTLDAHCSSQSHQQAADCCLPATGAQAGVRATRRQAAGLKDGLGNSEVQGSRGCSGWTRLWLNRHRHWRHQTCVTARGCRCASPDLLGAYKGSQMCCAQLGISQCLLTLHARRSLWGAYWGCGRGHTGSAGAAACAREWKSLGKGDLLVAMWWWCRPEHPAGSAGTTQQGLPEFQIRRLPPLRSSSGWWLASAPRLPAAATNPEPPVNLAVRWRLPKRLPWRATHHRHSHRSCCHQRRADQEAGCCDRV